MKFNGKFKNNYYLFFSTLVGYFVTDFFSGPSEGVQGIARSLIFNLGNYKIHLHHWIVFSVLLIILVFLRTKIKLIYLLALIGFLIGGTIQGLTYSDWWVVISRN